MCGPPHAMFKPPLYYYDILHARSIQKARYCNMGREDDVLVRSICGVETQMYKSLFVKMSLKSERGSPRCSIQSPPCIAHKTLIEALEWYLDSRYGH